MSALQNFPHYAIYCIYDILPHLSASHLNLKFAT